ncbi:GNAT family N-acetyltransferase [Aliikangiella marina]|uniref:GNAT family N-acetyltransferase n=1 Tax=Aliikangiella marina TaxID=1712262 RepID=A0A545TA29_9GAMM|nr:GNAT family N-acetyltransferase [Aliikangiella marina]TQV74066.1 GNAT family N-acetyltransferase [Aliikangiella marina]
MINIKPATLVQLHALHELFEGYRTFYDMPANEAKSLAFLKSRIDRQDSIIWLAFFKKQPAGFVQIYPAFTSVGMEQTWLLNDLFVAPAFRQKGVAKHLMQHVEAQAKLQRIFSIKLATQRSNDKAKKLYESLGYQKLDAFDHYSKSVD